MVGIIVVVVVVVVVVLVLVLVLLLLVLHLLVSLLLWTQAFSCEAIACACNHTTHAAYGVNCVCVCGVFVVIAVCFVHGVCGVCYVVTHKINFVTACKNMHGLIDAELAHQRQKQLVDV